MHTSTTHFLPAEDEVASCEGLPDGNVALCDGRRLILTRQTTFDVDGGTTQLCNHYAGPLGLSVIASIDPTSYAPLLHVSVSYSDHLPSWRDMRTVRDAFYSRDVDVMMMLPREEDYVNTHRFCLHLWQTPVEWGIR